MFLIPAMILCVICWRLGFFEVFSYLKHENLYKTFTNWIRRYSPYQQIIFCQWKWGWQKQLNLSTQNSAHTGRNLSHMGRNLQRKPTQPLSYINLSRLEENTKAKKPKNKQTKKPANNYCRLVEESLKNIFCCVINSMILDYHSYNNHNLYWYLNDVHFVSVLWVRCSPTISPTISFTWHCFPNCTLHPETTFLSAWQRTSISPYNWWRGSTPPIHAGTQFIHFMRSMHTMYHSEHIISSLKGMKDVGCFRMGPLGYWLGSWWEGSREDKRKIRPKE